MLTSSRSGARGDLAAAVETKYGEVRLQEYAADVGVAYGTMLNYRWVAARVPGGNLSMRKTFLQRGS